MGAHLKVRLFGEPLFAWDGKPFPHLQPRIQALLCFLAVQEVGATREELAELLWPPRQLQSVRQALHVLRALPGSTNWLFDGEVIRLEADVDLRTFLESMRQGRAEEALSVCPASLGVMIGIQVSAPPYQDWLAETRTLVSERRRDALQMRVANLEAQGKHADALMLVRQLLLLDPLDEAVLRQALRLEARAGSVEEGLVAFERCRAALWAELKAEPVTETLQALAALQGAASGSDTFAAQVVVDSVAVPGAPESFLGREEDLTVVMNGLQSSGRVLIHGFGGLGKTALATRAAQTWLQDKKGHVLWLELGETPLDATLDALALALGGQRRLAGARDAAWQGALTELLTAEQVTLIVLDNAWNAYTLVRLMVLIPDGVSLLITARHRYSMLQVIRLAIGVLPRHEALQLLSHYANQHQYFSERFSEYNALCVVLGDHPFALRLAGLHLRQVDGEGAALLEQLRHAPHTLLHPAIPDRNSIDHLLRFSLRGISDAAYTVFLTLGALFTSSGTAALLANCVRLPNGDIEEALEELAACGLADRHARPGADTVVYRLHDLSYSYAHAREALRPASVATAGLSYLRHFRDNLEALDAELWNVLSAAEHFRAVGEDKALVEMLLLLTSDGRYFTARGQTLPLRLLLTAAADAAVRGHDHSAASRLFMVLGNIHQIYLGQSELAFGAYQQARSHAAGASELSQEALCLNCMGVASLHLKRREADAHFREALALAHLANDPLGTCAILEQQGYAYGVQGQLGLARRVLSEALRVLPASDGHTMPHETERRRFYILLNLGEVEVEEGNYSEAVKLKQEALTIAEVHDHTLWRADAHGDLAAIAQRRSETGEARHHLAEALELFNQAGASSKGETLLTLMGSYGYVQDIELAIVGPES